MELKKRDCPITIELTPLSGYYLSVELTINGEKHHFLPSGAVSPLFCGLMAAAYRLYSENRDMDCHNQAYYFNKSYGRKHSKFDFGHRDPLSGICEQSVETSVEWDEEGSTSIIKLFRKICRESTTFTAGSPDPIVITIDYSRNEDKSGIFNYSVDGRDLCYAIAKAGTDALKKYGFYGYYYSTCNDDIEGDLIDINQLLFFKAYALDALSIRDFSKINVGEKSTTVYATDFTKEIELLLFDM